jgi:serine/threonine-protein kinase
MPFFSTDGEWIAFFAGSVLKKVAVAGGPAQTIASASGPSGGTWMDDGSIVFVGDPVQGVQRVPASGGTPETVLAGPIGSLDMFATPWGLPGSQAVLLLQKNGATFDAAVLSFKDKQVRVLAQDAYSPAWVPTGHLLFHQGDAILAMAFDPQTLTSTGGAFPVAQGIGNRISYQSRLFSVAADGTLVYVPAAPPGEGGWSMVLVDREGKETIAARLDRQADTPRFSPDGTRVAFRTPAPNCDIWVRDLARGTTTRLTREGDNHGVVWRPDGARVLTARVSSTGTEILALPADGAGAPEIVASVPGAAAMMPTSWSPTRALIVQDRFRQETGTDIVAIPASGGERQPLLNSPFDEGGGVISPDGELIAYVSDESGRNEIYVQPYAGQGQRMLVSINGGIEPVWSSAGDELFFRNGRDVLGVTMKPAAGRAAMQPRVLFSGDYPVGPQVANYDVSPDGRKLLMMRGRQWPEGQIVVVLNWIQELEKKRR